MPLFDPTLVGRYMKLGSHGLVRLGRVARATRGADAQGPHVVVHVRGGGPPLIYRGRPADVDRVKRSLEREGIPEV